MKKKTPIYMACIFHEYVLQWNYSLVWRDSIVWRDLNCECLFLKVIAATNRVDILDPALLRSGRLDRKIEFPHPNEEARARILQIHSRKMNVRYRIAICHVCCKIYFGCLKGIIIYTVWIIRYQRTVCYVNVKYMKVMWRWRVINDITKIREAETK